MAYGHRRHPGYFQDIAEFRDWLNEVASREAMRLFLRHGQVEPRFNLLPVDQRRLLGMVLIDGLHHGKAAAFLRIDPGEVGQRIQEALTALFRLLRDRRPEAD